MEKKQIVFICKDKQQCSVVVNEDEAVQVVEKLASDIFNNPDKLSICISDYVPTKDMTQKMYIRTSTINMIMVTNVNNKSNLTMPNKGLLVPQVGRC